jgi:hypothetical protein
VIQDDPPSAKRPGTIEGRELGPVVHLAKIAANALGVGARQVDVVVDRSDQTGLGARKRRLPTGTLEVLGPTPFNRLAGGGQAEIHCPTVFRLVADSDGGPFRDLLLLPDFYGHLLLKGADVAGRQRLVDSLRRNDFLLLPFDLSAAKASLVKDTGGTTNPATERAGSAGCS